ncbi:type 1 glutamine amidotransferase domain-containing protein [Microbulbifer guangxiensis]|uniref:type 1 glutamine amidotransferase domain-containing protein n=1 Tax=Microbulbifer guangxiensis TaxID=2904249 RepID=UPI001F456B53|nr:type 1 glutamine amidotransferase domain-containing protein [Microbulbifer guangxiensis]
MKKILGAILMLAALLSAVPSFAREEGPRVLMVLTSHSELGDSGEKTGFWMAELTHPYFALRKAGIPVEIVSISGGKAPVDPRSLKEDDEDNQRFLRDPQTRGLIEDTRPLSDVDPANYAAVIFVGGHGTMWDFPDHADVNRVAAGIYQANGVVAAVCHGPAALVGVTLGDGTKLIAGRRVTGFTNSEERAVGLEDVVPFMLEDALGKAGARFQGAPDWESNVVVDGRLITGQNPASARALGKAVAEAVKGQ